MTDEELKRTTIQIPPGSYFSSPTRYYKGWNLKVFVVLDEDQLD